MKIKILLSALIGFYLGCISIILISKNNGAYWHQQYLNEHQQVVECQTTLHAVKELINDLPFDWWEDVCVESYYWETIEDYFNTHKDPFEL